MTVPRSLCVLAGVMTSLGAALSVGAIAPVTGVIAVSWSAMTVVHALAMAATAAVTLLVTAAGALLAADWRADVQSREAWARMNAAAAGSSLSATRASCGEVDCRYAPAADNEVVRRIFRAHRLELRPPALDRAEGVSPRAAVASQGDRTDQSRRVFQGTRPAAATVVAGSRRKARGAGRATVRPRLVVNAKAWLGWPASAECIVSPTALQRHTADIIVLGNRQADRARPLPEPSAGGDISTSTKPPSCRGPPQRGHRSYAVGTGPTRPSPERAAFMPGAGKWPAGDPTVRDDLGDQIPISAAELDAIETYLDRVLGELLATTAGSREEQA